MNIKKDIKTIIEKIEYLKPISIILYGSYGRGEGAWFTNEKGEILPYNDYDILIVTEKIIPESEIKKIKSSLQKTIKIRWIDISQKTEKKMKSLTLSIFNYDLKYGSKVIYGKLNILKTIPEMDPANISLEEGNVLFKTRMWTFLGSLKKDGFKTELTNDESRFFRNQMAKALLAVIDILLLQKGLYISSYKKRLLRFKKFYPQKENMYELFNWALKEKLNPKAPIMSPLQVNKLYKRVHHIYLNEMFLMFSKFYRTSFSNPKKLIFLWKYSPRILLKRIAYLFIYRNLKFEKQILLEIAQLYLILSFSDNCNSRKNLLIKTSFILKSLDNSISRSLTWNQCRIIVSQIRLN